MKITKGWNVFAPLSLTSLGVILGISVSPWYALLTLAPPIAAIVFDAYSPARFG